MGNRSVLAGLIMLCFVAVFFTLESSALAQRPRGNNPRTPPQPPAGGQSEEMGVWDGAVWRFVLIPGAGNPSKGRLIGNFRLSDLKVYQGDSPNATEEMNRKIGQSEPSGGGRKPWSTTFTVEEMNTETPVNKENQKITLKASLVPDGRGKCKGKATSKDGYHWEMRCTRIQE